MWVKSEYAGELAVLSAWIAVLLPWNVTYSSFGDIGSTLFVRFPFLQVQYTWLPRITRQGEVITLRQTGVELVKGVWVADPITATVAAEGVAQNVVQVSATWTVGGALLALAFLLSLAMYFFEDRVEALGASLGASIESGPAPNSLSTLADPVRAMGALLLAGSVVLLVATYQIMTSTLPGFPIPVGIAITLVLSYTLLRVDRREFDGGETGPTPDPAAETDA